MTRSHDFTPRTIGPGTMLNFPNPSRSYDATRHAVRFWGHDTAMESSFFITESALQQMSNSALEGEAAFLSAFDIHRDLIHRVAVQVYGRGRRGSYELGASDF